MINDISNLLGWLAGSAAVPRWLVGVGAVGVMAIMGSAAFALWFLWLTRRFEAEAEHD